MVESALGVPGFELAQRLENVAESHGIIVVRKLDISHFGAIAATKLELDGVMMVIKNFNIFQIVKIGLGPLTVSKFLVLEDIR